MPRYIDADLLWNKILRAYQFSDRRGVMGYVKQCLNEAPTADVESVRRGRWNGVGKLFSEEWTCSNCGHMKGKGSGINFCGSCGAKMDGGEE